MQAYVEAALIECDRGMRWPWTVRLLDGTLAGWTSYGDVEPDHERIEIGWTAYAVPWQRTAVNTATKLLLLSQAFDDLGTAKLRSKPTIAMSVPSARSSGSAPSTRARCASI